MKIDKFITKFDVPVDFLYMYKLLDSKMMIGWFFNNKIFLSAKKYFDINFKYFFLSRFTMHKVIKELF